MYEIKKIPEDFAVEEVPLFDLNGLKKTGEYSYYLLEKKNLNTLDAVLIASRKLGANPKKINFAGSKDRNALTKQFISIAGGPEKEFEEKNIKVSYLGKSNERLNLGVLKGNNFKIFVRNINEKPENKNIFINYFGEQRFSEKNPEIGLLLLKRNFKDACAMISLKKIEEHLDKKPSDFIGALRKVNKKILTLFIHAYQSRIWNSVAEKISKTMSVKKNIGENISIPLIGFASNLSGKTGKMIDELLKSDCLNQRSFIFREIPEISSEGSERMLYAEAENLEISELKDDDLNPCMKKVELKFFLSKGCYATEFIRQLFC